VIKTTCVFFSIKSTDALISKFILVHNCTYFGQLPCPSSGRQTCIKRASAECTVDNDQMMGRGAARNM
jgi:hypothetical protein